MLQKKRNNLYGTALHGCDNEVLIIMVWRIAEEGGYMPSEELLEKVSHLPTTPGVYLWRDQYNRIIYVGKAINLRNRVRSYVRNDANRAPKVTAMMKRAVDVEIIQTKTEMEALILENTLIKEHKPKYNISL